MAYVEAVSNGTDPALGFRTRSNACRSGAFNRARVIVTVNGTQRKAIKPSLQIRVPTGREPATADLEFKGFVPERGQAVVIGHGTSDNALFRGRIVRAERTLVRHFEPRPTYAIEAVDSLFDLGRAYLPNGLAVQSLSAASLVRGIMSAATPSTTSLGFATTYVGDLPWVSEFVVGPAESVVSALDRLAAAIGGTWYSDTRQRLHFWTGTSDPETKPTIGTLTGTTTTYMALQRVSELPRVFSRVVGLGASTEVAHDVWSDDQYVPVESLEPITDVSSSFDLVTYRGVSTGRVVMHAAPRSMQYAIFPTELSHKPALLTAGPTSATGNYWVADIAEHDLGLGQDTFGDHRWVGIDGDYFRVSSISAFSSSANTLYSHIFVPSSGPGAPAPTNLGAVPAGTRFTAERGELFMAVDTSSPTPRIIPKGASVRVSYEVASTAIGNAIASLCNNLAVSVATDTVDDAGMRAPELVRACDQRLYEAHPDRWVTYRLSTRDPLFDRGQTVHLSVTGPAESGGPAITGSFPIQTVEIDAFDAMGDTKGPIRRVTLGPVTRPSLYLELERWEV